VLSVPIAGINVSELNVKTSSTNKAVCAPQIEYSDIIRTVDTDQTWAL
jgi:hypothetical protein